MHFILNLVKAKNQEIKNKNIIRRTAKILIFGYLLLAVFLFAQPVLAQAPDFGLGVVESGTGLITTDIRVLIADIIRIALGFLGIVAVIIILYGGFAYMTSGGVDDKIDKAKKILINAVIGLVIILSAFAIASFVINRLKDITRAGMGVPPEINSYYELGGALGGGIIESHFPPRGAQDIPRNTSVSISFKEPMDINTLINNNGTPANKNDDEVNTNNVLIRAKQCQGGSDDGAFCQENVDCELNNCLQVQVTDVKAFYLDDLKTFIYTPNQTLGSPAEDVWYEVQLSSDIQKDNGDAAFDITGYKWSFEVATNLDLTPPRIKSIDPVATLSPFTEVVRNDVLQIQFNEAINPVTLAGKAEVDSDPTKNIGNNLTGYNIIQVSYLDGATTKYVAGEFLFSNNYTTAEFIPLEVCGKNSCGEDIHCLPGVQDIDVKILAAELANPGSGETIATFPFTGIVDMANNSFDGNFDLLAQGPQTQSTFAPYNINQNIVNNIFEPNSTEGDDAFWTFSTSNLVDLTPPEIMRVYPDINATNVNPRADFLVIFDKKMLFSSLKPGNGYGDNKKYISLLPAGVAYRIGASYIDEQPDGLYDETEVKIRHEQLSPNTNYEIEVGSGVKDKRQNCYNPCSGPGCIRKESGTEGQYLPDVPPASNWSGGFPSCEL